MTDRRQLGRRRFLAGLAGGSAALLLSGCDKLSQNTTVVRVLDSAEALTKAVQRAITGRATMVAEFSDADISPAFRSNGTHDPDDATYQALARNGFADWKLDVGGLIEQPMRLSLADIRSLPSRTQITRHDCVEGWSCIGKWKGAQLSALLHEVRVKPEARYVMFFCADPMDLSGTKYYESADLEDAYHPQTILAYEMNDKPLEIPYGAPLRLRNERQLGYKMAKYIMRIDLVDSFAQVGGGRGGYWEDQGYEWYAGI
ncbi:MAG TPA: molybdopterin-binding protein [Alphaproteobacteria bacterium]|nr:molybdopterin-binding protein [Alphaproteobacteria bacterium]